jgi:hypothetical protein
MHSDLLDSLFYDLTIICESESDVRFYSFALREYLASSGIDVFWFSCGGKDGMPRVGATLAKIGVRTVYIFDIDVLLTDNVLQAACASHGLDITTKIPELRRALDALRVNPAAEVIADVAKLLETVPEDGDDKAVEHAVREIRKTASRMQKSWTLKHSGISSVPKGKPYATVINLIEKCGQNGIVVLKGGEIESYIKEVESHGSRWVHEVIENADAYRHPISTLGDEVGTAISAWVKEE